MAPANPRGPGLGITESVVLGKRNANSILVAVNASEGKPSEKWEWLGTFREALSYGSTDPDVPDVSDLGDSEKEAIDAVMMMPSGRGGYAEAIRMREKLSEIASGFQSMRDLETIAEEDEEEAEEEKDGGSVPPAPDADRVVELLLEVRDTIGEQTDFANAFLALGGMSVLLGASSERLLVPREVRSTCLLVLSDLTKRHPSVQYTLLNHGILRALAALYFAEFPKPLPGKSIETDKIDESDGLLRGRIVRSMDAAVSGHAGAERQFCASAQSRKVIESGVGMHASDETLPVPPAPLRLQSLEFLRDVLTSKHSSSMRVDGFQPCLEYVAGSVLSEETEPVWKVRKVALNMFLSLLKQKKGVEAILELRESFGAAGETSVARAREALEADGNETMPPQRREALESELALWERLNSELEKAAAASSSG